jgi:hypothetical protein
MSNPVVLITGGPTLRVPPSFSLPKKHHSSPAISSTSTAATPLTDRRRVHDCSWRSGRIDAGSTQNRQWILNTRPSGRLTGEEFRWNEAPVPQPSDGQVLVRNLWLSVDPAQRTWMARDSYKPAVPLGDVMQSFAVGRVYWVSPP